MPGWLDRLLGRGGGEEIAPAPPRVVHTTDTALDEAKALLMAGQAADAALMCERLVAADDSQAERWALLGRAKMALKSFPEAVVALNRAVDLSPDVAAFHRDLALALTLGGRPEHAITPHMRAADLSPKDAALQSEAGRVLADASRLPEAVEYYRRAFALLPQSGEAAAALSNALQALGKVDDAIAPASRAAELLPQSGEIAGSLAAVLTAAGRMDEAAAAFARAAQLLPAVAEIFAGYGKVEAERGRLVAAIANYRRAVTLKPGLVAAQVGLADALYSIGRVEEAAHAYEQAVTLEPKTLALRSSRLICMYSLPQISPQRALVEHRLWERWTGASPERKHRNAPDPARRIRVGYVSPDFNRNSCATFMLPLIESHDHAAVEVFCYAEATRRDAVTERFHTVAENWRETQGKSDDDVAAMVAADQIDILVDAAGHGPGNRLGVFARKPAPVQATWLGQRSTTGLSAIDYKITDDLLDPVGDADGCHSEALVRLEAGCVAYRPLDAQPQTGGAPYAATTFGSFNNLSKLSPAAVETWAVILQSCPGSRLMLKAKPLGDEGIRQEVSERFARHGIPSDRLLLQGGVDDPAVHFALYGQVHVALDPFPYNGATTTCEALYMGVPVVTLSGDRSVSRIGASLLARVGLSDLVADTREEYVRLAVALANDQDRRLKLRRTLNSTMMASSLCDMPSFTRSMETAYREMWRRWCARAGRA